MGVVELCRELDRATKTTRLTALTNLCESLSTEEVQQALDGVTTVHFYDSREASGEGWDMPVRSALKAVIIGLKESKESRAKEGSIQQQQQKLTRLLRRVLLEADGRRSMGRLGCDTVQFVIERLYEILKLMDDNAKAQEDILRALVLSPLRFKRYREQFGASKRWNSVWSYLRKVDKKFEKAYLVKVFYRLLLCSPHSLATKSKDIIETASKLLVGLSDDRISCAIVVAGLNHLYREIPLDIDPAGLQRLVPTIIAFWPQSDVDLKRQVVDFIRLHEPHLTFDHYQALFDKIEDDWTQNHPAFALPTAQADVIASVFLYLWNSSAEEQESRGPKRARRRLPIDFIKSNLEVQQRNCIACLSVLTSLCRLSTSVEIPHAIYLALLPLLYSSNLPSEIAVLAYQVVTSIIRCIGLQFPDLPALKTFLKQCFDRLSLVTVADAVADLLHAAIEASLLTPQDLAAQQPTKLLEPGTLHKSAKVARLLVAMFGLVPLGSANTGAWYRWVAEVADALPCWLLADALLLLFRPTITASVAELQPISLISCINDVKKVETEMSDALLCDVQLLQRIYGHGQLASSSSNLLTKSTATSEPQSNASFSRLLSAPALESRWQSLIKTIKDILLRNAEKKSSDDRRQMHLAVGILLTIGYLKQLEFVTAELDEIQDTTAGFVMDLVRKSADSSLSQLADMLEIISQCVGLPATRPWHQRCLSSKFTTGNTNLKPLNNETWAAAQCLPLIDLFNFLQKLFCDLSTIKQIEEDGGDEAGRREQRAEYIVVVPCVDARLDENETTPHAIVRLLCLRLLGVRYYFSSKPQIEEFPMSVLVFDSFAPGCSPLLLRLEALYWIQLLGSRGHANLAFGALECVLKDVSFLTNQNDFSFRCWENVTVVRFVGLLGSLLLRLSQNTALDEKESMHQIIQSLYEELVLDRWADFAGEVELNYWNHRRAITNSTEMEVDIQRCCGAFYDSPLVRLELAHTLHLLLEDGAAALLQTTSGDNMATEKLAYKDLEPFNLLISPPDPKVPSLSNDSNSTVRLLTLRAAAQALKHQPVKSHPDLLQRLYVPKDSLPSAWVSFAFCLAEVADNSSTAATSALMIMMTRFPSEDPPIPDQTYEYVERLLDSVSKRLGLNSRKQLVDALEPCLAKTILGHFVENELPVPLVHFHVNDLAKLSGSGTLLSLALSTQQWDVFEHVQKLQGISMNDLLSKHMGRLLAVYLVSEPELANEIKTWLIDHQNIKKWSDLFFLYYASCMKHLFFLLKDDLYFSSLAGSQFEELAVTLQLNPSVVSPLAEAWEIDVSPLSYSAHRICSGFLLINNAFNVPNKQDLASVVLEIASKMPTALIKTLTAISVRFQKTIWPLDRFRMFLAYRLALGLLLPSLLKSNTKSKKNKYLVHNLVRSSLRTLAHWIVGSVEPTLQSNFEATILWVINIVKETKPDVLMMEIEPIVAILTSTNVHISDNLHANLDIYIQSSPASMSIDAPSHQTLEAIYQKFSKSGYVLSIDDLSAVSNALLHNPSLISIERDLLANIKHCIISLSRKVAPASLASRLCVQLLGQLSSVTTLSTTPNSDLSSFTYLAYDDYCQHILIQMCDMLVDANPEVVEATQASLLHILAEKGNVNLLKSISDLYSDILSLYAQDTSPISEVVIDKKIPALTQELWSCHGCSLETWIGRLTQALIALLLQRSKDSYKFVAYLGRVCALKPSFASLIFPLVLEQAILAEPKLLLGHLDAFFKKHKDQPIAAVKSALGGILRLQRRRYCPAGQKPLMGNFEKDLNLLVTSEAAMRCNAPATSLLLLELYFSDQNMTYSRPAIQIDDAAAVPMYQSILLKVFSSLDDPDGLYGVTSSSGYSSLARRYEHEGDWIKMLQLHDSQIRYSNQTTAQSSIAIALRELGLHHTMNSFLHSTATPAVSDAQLQELRFEAAWRNSVWDLDATNLSTSSIGLHSDIYSVLLAIHNDDTAYLWTLLENSSKHLFNDILHLNVNETTNIGETLRKAAIVSDLENIFQMLKHQSQDDIMTLLKVWDYQLMQANNEGSFDEMELRLSVRGAALETLLTKPTITNYLMHQNLGIHLQKHLLECAHISRKANKIPAASNYLAQLGQFRRRLATPTTQYILQSDVYIRSEIEAVELFRGQGQYETAIALLGDILQRQSTNHPLELCQLYTLMGECMHESRSQPANMIMKQYFEPAEINAQKALKGNIKVATEITQSYHAMALFSDTQYKLISDRLGSEEIQRMRKVAQEMIDKNEAKNQLKQAKAFDDEIKDLIKKRHEYLTSAMNNFSETLRWGDQYNVNIFRLCSLWFSVGGELESAKDEDDCLLAVMVNRIAKEKFPIIESRKFLPLAYQLVARIPAVIESTTDSFVYLLLELALRLGREHPYHILFKLCALTYDKMKKEEVNNSQLLKAGHHKRVEQILGQLPKQLVQKIRQLTIAYIQLAYTENQPVPKNHIPENIMTKLIDRSLPILTLALPVDPSLKYDRMVKIYDIDSKYTQPAGKSKPKRITIKGDDGQRYEQLVKSGDNLRQDAVMQQVFGLVNDFLVHRASTRRRQLSVRTYNIIPLSADTGVLEWLSSTKVLLAYLDEAHEKYGTINAKSQHTFFEQLKNAQEKPQGDCLKAFREIRNSFKPVLRHFFGENFANPVECFNRRRAYTRSIASTAMVGYVMGLGDRHSQNILLDTNTAEAIQIDLGIAFDQGQLLKIPERVAFRLTREIVDGMGITQVEGIFRRCCEETMHVLREEAEAILTILEVLKQDPLYRWTLDSTRSVQGVDRNELSRAGSVASNTSSNAPSRAVLRVKEKLQGIEGSAVLNVAGQVNQLISQAGDEGNLSRMYAGWRPWL